MLYLNLIIISYTQLCSKQTVLCVDADTGLGHIIYSLLLIYCWCLQNINIFKSIILIFLNLKKYDRCLTIVCYIGLKAMYVMH